MEAQDSASPPPKVFISYRWSTPEHSDWVIALASSLRRDGTDVKLDRWDLTPGQDAIAFMEAMVTDPEVTKVLLVCDRGYVERADLRKGGVGIESQIISPKVYEKTDQEKFAAIVLELDADGRPLVPTFMASRIYFDMTSKEVEAENYPQIVRWIFNKPFHVRPAVGQPPQFLDDNYRPPIELFSNQTSRSARSGATASGAASGMFDTIVRESQNLILDLAGQPDPAETAYKAMLSTVPIREQVYGALRDVLRSDSNRITDIIHGFFEGLIRHWDYTPPDRQYSRWDNDALHYFIHDCFVGFVAICIDEAKFDTLAEILSTPLFRPDRDGKTGKTSYYPDYRPALGSLETRNQALKLNRISLHADVLSETHEHSEVPFANFMEADFLLYVRGVLDERLNWYPISGVWLARSYGSLRLFARAESSRYYDRIKPLLLGQSADEVRTALAPYISGEKRLVRFDYESLPLTQLMNLEKLSTAA